MNLIKKALLLSGIIYGILFVIELIQGHILWQGIAGLLVLAFLSYLPEVKNEHLLHNGEMIIVWACILLFGFYAGLKIGGIL